MSRPEQEQVRIEKLAQLRAQGFRYPNQVAVDASSASVLAASVGEPPESGKSYTIAGRIMQLRLMGKAAFVHVMDGAGKIQVYVRKDDVGEALYEQFKAFDIGDIIEVSGFAFITKTGEKSLHAKRLQLLSKCLIPLPEKWHGLTDVEVRYRRRYVDLIANPEVREVFRKRAQIIREVRAFLDERGYLEVETPTFNFSNGGASARPFMTHYNSLGCDMFLRIAHELPLKKLVVGGLERVYELAKVFRNEGFSKKHNPEFTMLEFYQAYATFDDLMKLTEEMLTRIAQRVCGTLKIPYGDKIIDLTPPWPRVGMLESIHSIGGVSRDVDLSSVQGLQQVATKHRIELEEPNDWGRSLETLWGELVESKIVNPVFITYHPLAISPLARRNDRNPEITDRFELIINGAETANAFSELNDPEDQRQRFEEQARRKAAGDQEAQDVDEDFIRALEYGLPPTAGQGIGIDRLVMLLTNSQTIRDVVLFPQLKPDDGSAA